VSVDLILPNGWGAARVATSGTRWWKQSIKKCRRLQFKPEKYKTSTDREFFREADLRRATGIGELDRVLGGGIVAGSLILVGGDPGIGKSTLLLSAASRFAGLHGNVLYVSGEESAAQTGLRARRTGALEEKMWVLAETNLEAILAEAEKCNR